MCQIDPRRKVVAVDLRSRIERAKTSEECGKFGSTAGVRLRKHSLQLGAGAVSRLTPNEAAAPSTPMPEATFAAILASATVRPNAVHNCVASGRSGDARSVREKDQAPGAKQIAAECRDRHRFTRSQGASSRSTTIGA